MTLSFTIAATIVALAVIVSNASLMTNESFS